MQNQGPVEISRSSNFFVILYVATHDPEWLVATIFCTAVGMDKQKDHYEILGVSPSATKTEIEKQYKEKGMTL
jgi:DnaJ-domain-containing protein 1